MARSKRKIFKRLSLLAVGVFISYLIIPFSNETPTADYSQVVLTRDSTILRVFLNDKEQWCLPPQLIDEIPENLKTAVLTYEDQYFDFHPGINPIALIRAAYLNIKQGKVVSGGSTITMQLARMIRQNPRTFRHKIEEMFLAFKLEVWHSKDQILKDYLTHAPYGSNVNGFIAASYRFFGKEPHLLSWAEAATLAVLPNAPGLIFPSKNTDLLIAKRNGLLLKLFHKGEIDKETYELSLLEQIPDHIIPFPLAAPHLTDKIHSENKLSIVVTSIDSRVQEETNFFVKQHSGKLSQMGIYNACALVLDNETGKVVSYVGSQNYNDLSREGRVDGIQSFRSSGSILKPFLYALAIDDGIILPQTLIKDVPTYFESFSPSNASEKFEGIVPAKNALIYSLNIPAVRLLNAYGVSTFYNQLKAAGITSLFRNADDYGLPLILGGAEVSPWEMAKLYAGMANGGEFGEIAFYKDQFNANTKRKLVSEGATFLIMDELKELIRPGLEFYWKKYGNQRPIAWKTGTSYGHKDAWAVGSTPQWTIVTWVGNFNGESNKSISGMRSAGPLLFSILNSLPSVPKREKWFKKDIEDYSQVELCKETGFYAGEFCEKKEYAASPKNMKPLKICPYHKRFFISEDKKHSVCSYCWKKGHKEKDILKYTSDVNYYLRKNGTLISQEPMHNPDCKKKQESDVLKIIYPYPNANIYIPKDFSGAYEPLVSRVAAYFTKRELFWYLDNRFLGSSVKKSSFLIDIGSGSHTLTVVDAEGNRDEVSFNTIKN